MSSSSDLAIRVRGLGKQYTISKGQQSAESTLTETLLRRARNPFARAEKDSFWALKDVDFDIRKGEVVGVVGRNGAGKSTLLKVLSQITEPTTGEIQLFGRVGSLLEVGTGFHPELTGRENIFLNGAILGMTRAEIKKQFDAIVDFSGVEKFLDTPVKRYSSGMYVRLAFAVAAHLETEILVIDEVLAVGDAEFQNKCMGKMKDVARGGRTVLFVSHQMQAVSTLCTHGIYMESGRAKYAGSVRETIQRYMDYRPESSSATDVRRGGSGELRITRFELDRPMYASTDTITFDMDIAVVRETQPSYFISVEVVNTLGLTVLHMDSRLLNREFGSSDNRTIRYSIRNPRLVQGDYRVNVFICTSGGVVDRFEGAGQFTVSPLLPYPAGRGDVAGNALVYADFSVTDRELSPGGIQPASKT